MGKCFPVCPESNLRSARLIMRACLETQKTDGYHLHQERITSISGRGVQAICPPQSLYFRPRKTSSPSIRASRTMTGRTSSIATAASCMARVSGELGLRSDCGSWLRVMLVVCRARLNDPGAEGAIGDIAETTCDICF